MKRKQNNHLPGYQLDKNEVTSITFKVGGFFDGYTETTIQKNTEYAAVEIQSTFIIPRCTGPTQISLEKWQEIVDKLYLDLHINKWKKEYVNPEVMDGTQWSLEITFANNRKCVYSGSNAYPSRWRELTKLFKDLENYMSNE